LQLTLTMAWAGGKRTVPYLWPVTDLLLLNMYWAEVMLRFVCVK